MNRASAAMIRGLMRFGPGLLPFADAATAVAVQTAELAYYNRHGQLIWSEPRGRLAGYPAPQLSSTAGSCSSCCGTRSWNGLVPTPS
jgi:hypothetical protein